MIDEIRSRNRLVAISVVAVVLLGSLFTFLSKPGQGVRGENSQNSINADIREKSDVKIPVASSLMSLEEIDNIDETNAGKAAKNGNDSNWLLSLMNYRKAENKILNVPAEYKTIQSAIEAARRGDIVKVSAGEYRENILMKNGVSVEGAGSDKTMLDGNSLGNTVSFKGIRSAKTQLAGFTIKNAGKNLSGVSIDDSSPWIHDNIITENEFGIYIRGESRPVIQKNIINNSSQGIQVYNFFDALEKTQKKGKASPQESSTKPVIIDNLITDNKIGIDIYNSAAVIEHNNISYNNHYKIYLGSTYGINISASSSKISNNIITDNGICELCAGILVDAESKNVTISYNDIWNNNNDYLCFGECSLEESNISENPLYADTMSGDYRLKPESPLLKKAEDGLDMGIRW